MQFPNNKLRQDEDEQIQDEIEVASSKVKGLFAQAGSLCPWLPDSLDRKTARALGDDLCDIGENIQHHEDLVHPVPGTLASAMGTEDASWLTTLAEQAKKKKRQEGRQ